MTTDQWQNRLPGWNIWCYHHGTAIARVQPVYLLNSHQWHYSQVTSVF